MLPTFVIGLREGLEASLIVGIVAAFLRQRGRSDLLRWVFVGIFAAVALCTAAGVTLDVVSRNLPQRQQEGLETVIAMVAVGMVTYMVVWMKRHSRELKGQLDTAAGDAVATGSALALVGMAFLAVLREGLETVVFLLAAFNESGSGGTAALGAVLGIATAIGLGYAVYRGGVRLNLSRFFRATGFVLVLVAAGLVVSALHTAHEAGWLNVGQQTTVDLSSVVDPGSVQASLLTGMLGFQSRPVLVEMAGWLLYLVPVGLYVVWPPGRVPSRTTVGRLTGVAGAAAAVCAVVLALLAPGPPAEHPMTVAGGVATQVLDRDGPHATIGTGWLRPAQPEAARVSLHLEADRVGAERRDGVDTVLYRSTRTSTAPGPSTVAVQRLAELGGGRLPLGVVVAGADVTERPVPVTRRSVDVATVWVAADTGRVVNVRWVEQVSLVAHFEAGDAVIGSPRRATTGFTTAQSAWAGAQARQDTATNDEHRLLTSLAVLLGVAATALLLVALGTVMAGRRRRTPVSRSLEVLAPSRRL